MLIDPEEALPGLAAISTATNTPFSLMRTIVLSLLCVVAVLSRPSKVTSVKPAGRSNWDVLLQCEGLYEITVTSL